jgi:uncharacterized membrane protein YdbT with pleckstrin-like domain
MWEHDRMGLPPELLGAGEVEVLSLRTHVKALFAPAVVLVLVAIAIGMSFALPANMQPWASWVIGVAGVLALILWVLVPFLRWATTTYTFTNRRIITRRGIINKSGHDLPLTRIVNVAYSLSLSDRIFGCGTLSLTTAADAPVTLDDIPDVERVHVMMTELLFGGDTPARAPKVKDE